MRRIITYEGIDEALKNLRYANRNSLKSRLVNTIREQYRLFEGCVDPVTGIDTDFLVKTLWETGDDPRLIKSKRKNFNSVKSTVNIDLKRLYSNGLNKEGIVINQKNIFDMSDEAKSEMLESFSYGGEGNSQIPLDRITDVLSIINDFISQRESALEENTGLEQIKELIRDISGKMGISTVSQGGNFSGSKTRDEEYEDIELDGLSEKDLEDAAEDEADTADEELEELGMEEGLLNKLEYEEV